VKDREGGNVKHSRQLCRWVGLLLYTMLVLTNCTYETAVGRLSLPEQAEFRLYRHVMTPAQVRTYLAQATASERTGYLTKVGLAQRLQALDQQDRDAVRSSLPRQGISAEALRFIWGEPYYTAGRAHHYEHWYYLGYSIALAATDHRHIWFGNRVDVYLVDDRVVGWVDFVPIIQESGQCPEC
jgi:hypothetical protein